VVIDLLQQYSDPEFLEEGEVDEEEGRNYLKEEVVKEECHSKQQQEQSQEQASKPKSLQSPK